MKLPFEYYPATFFSITIFFSLALVPVLTYLSNRGKSEKGFYFLFLNLLVPCITAIGMIYFSGSSEMIEDFWKRLLLFKIPLNYLAFIIFLMPCIILLATGISLLFGHSAKQFHLAKEFSIVKGWGFLGVIFPILLAPLIEELGWRGYGVDSLRAYFNLFTTSLLFGLLWFLWHLPLFFLKGFYHHQLWHQNKIYALNFFASTLVAAFLMNWIYYNVDRSIPAMVLFHSMLNLSSILLRTEQFTKCIATVLLFFVFIISISI